MRNSFRRASQNASLLHQSVTLCRSLLNVQQRFESGFIDAVRTLLNRLTAKGKISKREINERISNLIQQSVHSDGVVNLFVDKAEFSLFDEKFMEEVKQMKEKNKGYEQLAKVHSAYISILLKKLGATDSNTAISLTQEEVKEALEKNETRATIDGDGYKLYCESIE